MQQGMQPLVETALHPLVSSKVPGKHVPGSADVNLRLSIAFNGSAGRYEINGASFDPPTAPVLLQILSGVPTAQEVLPKGSIYELPPNKVVEISIPGGSPRVPQILKTPLSRFDRAKKLPRKIGSGATSLRFVSSAIADSHFPDIDEVSERRIVAKTMMRRI
ncbi:hypothetical protein DFH09DRAFT_1096532 [Mycena vulgaris]|nr:hypothetical protein DFH09DRAFT_1096532 [Mycena vulgaris]